MKMHKYILIAYIIISTLALGMPAGSFDDPLDICPSVSSMGMGRTGLVYANPTISSIFTNPALLMRLNDLSFTSTYVNLLSDVSYLNLAGATPFRDGVVGFGFVQSGVAGLDYPTSYDPITGNPVLTKTDYYNRLFMPTYSRTFKTPIGDVDTGVGLKMFQQGASDLGYTSSGIDLNLGLAGKTPIGVNWGLVLSNALPMKNTWTTPYGNTEEDIPSSLRFGVGTSFLNDRINVELDMENPWGYQGRPILYHGGAELHMYNRLFLRAGVDQSAVPGVGGGSTSVYNNMTLGVGAKLGTFSFDYAYRAYNDVAGTNTHFISLTYLGQEKAKILSTLPQLVLNPAIGFSTMDAYIKVAGQVPPKTVKAVKIGDNKVLYDGQNFSSDVKLDPTQPLDINIELATEGKIGKMSVKRNYMRGFDDVKTTDPAYASIMGAARSGLMRAYPGRLFMPDRVIDRNEFARIMALDGLTEEALYISQSPIKKTTPATMALADKLLGKYLAKGEKVLASASEAKNRVTRKNMAILLGRTNLIKYKEPLTVLKLTFEKQRVEIEFGCFQENAANLNKEVFSAQLTADGVLFTMPRFASAPDIRVYDNKSKVWAKPNNLKLVSIDKETATFLYKMAIF